MISKDKVKPKLPLLSSWVNYAVIAGVVWMGWQVLREPIADVLPPGQALAISAGSSTVLGRSAEAEYAAKRYENAAFLAREALSKAPFNVRALRIVGLTEAQAGRTDIADQIITLAGNWSLRDDPSHAWLLQHRLSRGDYHSAYAHADTIARRREDLRPRLFNLFTSAAKQDPRSLPHLSRLISNNPPWKAEYLNSLHGDQAGLVLASQLAVMLQSSRAPLSTDELSTLNRRLVAKGLFDLMGNVRKGVGRPDVDLLLVNGTFETISQPAPYEWALINAPGIFLEILPDPVRNSSALRVEDTGYFREPVVQQVLQLPVGSYRFTGQMMVEYGGVDDELVWSISCYESSRTLGRPVAENVSGQSQWRAMSLNFNVPAQGCTAQVIRLVPAISDLRENVAIWYDNFSIQRVD